VMDSISIQSTSVFARCSMCPSLATFERVNFRG
jgi:hypothetical protein